MKEKNWLAIGMGLFFVVFVSVVFTNAWFEYEQLRVNQDLYYDPGVANEIPIFGIALVALGVLLIIVGWIIVGWIGPVQLPVDRPRGD